MSKRKRGVCARTFVGCVQGKASAVCRRMRGVLASVGVEYVQAQMLVGSGCQRCGSVGEGV